MLRKLLDIKAKVAKADDLVYNHVFVKQLLTEALADLNEVIESHNVVKPTIAWYDEAAGSFYLRKEHITDYVKNSHKFVELIEKD